MASIVLASASPYRRRLLARLGIEFDVTAPAIDETPMPGEQADALVRRLSRSKAHKVAETHPARIVIASDQAGSGPAGPLGKPGSIDAAIRQLCSVSGREVRFLTGLCVLDRSSGRELLDVVQCTVRFRELSRQAIEDYVTREQPLDCAGSFKVEGLGIALFDSLHLDDPTALEGLPLIRLTSFLAESGLQVLGR